MRPLYNEVTIACGAFVSTLVITDPRYDVTNLGGFLEQVPARLGRNKALDVCSRAFTGAMASVRAEQVHLQALTDYGTAMRVLREHLGDRQLAFSPETLVATYLLCLCQVRRPAAGSVANGRCTSSMIIARRTCGVLRFWLKLRPTRPGLTLFMARCSRRVRLVWYVVLLGGSADG